MRGRFTGITPAMHALLRVGAGLLFMQHGAQKLFGWLGGFGGTPGATADLFSQMGLAGVLEFFGGLVIVIGLATRPLAFILAVEMVWAYFQAHAPQGGFPSQNGGELALLYMLIFTFLAAAGAGPLSLDRLIGARRRHAPETRVEVREEAEPVRTPARERTPAPRPVLREPGTPEKGVR